MTIQRGRWANYQWVPGMHHVKYGIWEIMTPAERAQFNFALDLSLDHLGRISSTQLASNAKELADG
jgi:hypothetical protein